MLERGVIYTVALHLWVMNAVFKVAQGIVAYKGKMSSLFWWCGQVGRQ